MDDGVGLENQSSDLSLPWVRIPPSPQMREIHPFGSFIPKNCRYLILGTFPGKKNKENNWFYGSKKNQFWIILENVYKQNLNTISEKKGFLKEYKIAITDTISSCIRKENTNLDTNLVNIVYNDNLIKKILKENKIEIIFFTSRFAEKLFIKQMKKDTLLYSKSKLCLLPSPSPRYAKLSLSDKIIRYKKLLPKI